MPRLSGMNRCIEIEYADADGTFTRRKVNVSSFYRQRHESTWYVEGFCHLRREKRTFRTDRISRLWDVRSGGALVGNATQWVESLWLAGPEGRLHQERVDREEARAEREKVQEEARSVVESQFHGLRTLIYVAKADKFLRAAEKRLILFFFKRIAAYRMDDPEVEDAAIKLALKIDTPSTGQFYYSVRQVAQRGRRYRMAVCATAKAIINTDKKVSPYELEVLDYLVRKLKPLDD